MYVMFWLYLYIFFFFFFFNDTATTEIYTGWYTLSLHDALPIYFRAAGAMDGLAHLLGPVTSRIGLPPEVLPMAIVRPLSGGGSLGILGSILSAPGLGPDSYAGRLASVLQGSTETTFYVLSVYCGAAGIVRYRHSLVAGLCADASGLIATVIIARLLWG